MTLSFKSMGGSPVGTDPVIPDGIVDKQIDREAEHQTHPMIHMVLEFGEKKGSLGLHNSKPPDARSSMYGMME